jgi:hypothetical protein
VKLTARRSGQSFERLVRRTDKDGSASHMDHDPSVPYPDEVVYDLTLLLGILFFAARARIDLCALKL